MDTAKYTLKSLGSEAVTWPNDAARYVKAVSKTAESIIVRLKKRNDVDDLKFPFQNTTTVRLLMMSPTTAIIPMMSIPTNIML